MKKRPTTDGDMLAARHREVMATRLRMQGKDWEYIARRCGYENPSTAYQAVYRALKRIPMESVEELRDTELRRLDILQDIAWTRLRLLSDPKKGKMRQIGGARSADPLDPIPVILKIMERRAKLVGLDAPERHNVLFTEAQKISAQTGIPVEQIVAMAEQMGSEGNEIPSAFVKAFAGE
jgi:hypothetical protein